MHVWSKLTSAQWRDAWEERFHALDDTSLVITELPGKKTSRVEMFCVDKELALKMQKEFGGSVREVKQQNWQALSVPKINPIKIRDKFLVVCTSDEKEIAKARKANPGRELLLIPIEMAFGTGDHPTTATCLRLLCDMKLEGRSVLDLGCGTGILSLAAKKLGAKKVLGADFDRHAVEASKQNAIRNNVEGVTFQKKDVLTWEPKGTWDVIMANIFADVLTAAFPKMKSLLAPGGVLVLSGILDKHWPDLEKEARKTGFVVQQKLQKGKWVTAWCEAATTDVPRSKRDIASRMV